MYSVWYLCVSSQDIKISEYMPVIHVFSMQWKFIIDLENICRTNALTKTDDFTVLRNSSQSSGFCLDFATQGNLYMA